MEPVFFFKFSRVWQHFGFFLKPFKLNTQKKQEYIDGRWIRWIRQIGFCIQCKITPKRNKKPIQKPNDVQSRFKRNEWTKQNLRWTKLRFRICGSPVKYDAPWNKIHNKGTKSSFSLCPNPPGLLNEKELRRLP